MEVGTAARGVYKLRGVELGRAGVCVDRRKILDSIRSVATRSEVV